MTMRCSDCRDLLSAYLDGELPPDESSAVDHHLAQCPDCPSARDALAVTSRRLQESLVSHRAPDVLKARIRSAIAEGDAMESRPRASSTPRWMSLAAAAVVIAVVSSVATVGVMHRRTQVGSVANELLSSHVRSLMPGHLVDVVSNDQHNVKPWFNGRVNLSPQVPALDTAGFRLVGGRLDYVGSRPVAVVVYARREHIINVYSWPEAGGDGNAAANAQGYHMIRWHTDGIEYWAVSDLNTSELSQFVGLFRGGATGAVQR